MYVCIGRRNEGKGQLNDSTPDESIHFGESIHGESIQSLSIDSNLEVGGISYKYLGSVHKQVNCQYQQFNMPQTSLKSS